MIGINRFGDFQYFTDWDDIWSLGDGVIEVLERDVRDVTRKISWVFIGYDTAKEAENVFFDKVGHYRFEFHKANHVEIHKQDDGWLAHFSQKKGDAVFVTIRFIKKVDN